MPEASSNQVPRARVQTLSDLVFGFALSIALALISQQPYELSELLIVQASSYTNMGRYASIAYALDIAGLNLIVGWFLHALANEEKRLVPRVLLRHYRLLRNFMFAGATVFTLSLLPISWT